MAYGNSVDPEQTFRSSLIKVYIVCHTSKYSKKHLHQSKSVAKIYDQKSME